MPKNSELDGSLIAAAVNELDYCIALLLLQAERDLLLD